MKVFKNRVEINVKTAFYLGQTAENMLIQRIEDLIPQSNIALKKSLYLIVQSII